MTPLALAWRGIVRQPARAALAVLGVATVSALLFDMLMLSQGLFISFGHLLEETGFDVRVTATKALPMLGPRVRGAEKASRELSSLPEVASVLPMRIEWASMATNDDEELDVIFIGVQSAPEQPWTILEGDGLMDRVGDAQPPVLLNAYLAEVLDADPGDTLSLRGRCDGAGNALPTTEFRVAGVADFPYDSSGTPRVAVTLQAFRHTCGLDAEDAVDVLLVTSAPGAGPDGAVAAIRAARPDLHPLTNRQIMNRVQQTEFSYFRQIAFVLASITLFFAFLLIATLLAVSVNQRFGEIAALRALGFTRWRIVANLFCESALLVGAGGLLALPAGGLLALWLDGILRQMPGIPTHLHFFVFEPRALLLYLGLLALTGLLAALYPIHLAIRLPIAATLRNEVVS